MGRETVSLTQDFQGGECSWHRYSGVHLATLDRDRTAQRRLRGERTRLGIARTGGRKGGVVWSKKTYV